MTPRNFPVKEALPVGQQDGAIALKVEKLELEVEEVGEVLLSEPMKFSQDDEVMVWMETMRLFSHCFLAEGS